MFKPFAAALALALLVGCGQTGMPMTAQVAGTDMDALGRGKTPAEKAMKLLDTDKDGVVSPEEWETFKLAGAYKARESAQKTLEAAKAKGDSKAIAYAQKQLEGLDEDIKYLKKDAALIFEMIDTDHSGKLELAELTLKVTGTMKRK
jgi:Ca2+-binding EF-hand superfamily protein